MDNDKIANIYVVKLNDECKTYNLNLWNLSDLTNKDKRVGCR